MSIQYTCNSRSLDCEVRRYGTRKHLFTSSRILCNANSQQLEYSMGRCRCTCNSRSLDWEILRYGTRKHFVTKFATTRILDGKMMMLYTHVTFTHSIKRYGTRKQLFTSSRILGNMTCKQTRTLD